MRDEQSLLFPAREFANGPVGIRSCANQIDGFLNAAVSIPLLAALEERQGQAPVPSIQPEPHYAAPADMHLGLKMAPLWYIADSGVAPPRWMAQHGDRPTRERDQPEDRFEQGGLAGTIGAEDGQELPRLDRKLHLLPDGAPAEGDGYVLHLDDRGKTGRGRRR